MPKLPNDPNSSSLPPIAIRQRAPIPTEELDSLARSVVNDVHIGRAMSGSWVSQESLDMALQHDSFFSDITGLNAETIRGPNRSEIATQFAIALNNRIYIPNDLYLSLKVRENEPVNFDYMTIDRTRWERTPYINGTSIWCTSYANRHIQVDAVKSLPPALTVSNLVFLDPTKVEENNLELWNALNIDQPYSFLSALKTLANRLEIRSNTDMCDQVILPCCRARFMEHARQNILLALHTGQRDIIPPNVGERFCKILPSTMPERLANVSSHTCNEIMKSVAARSLGVLSFLRDTVANHEDEKAYLALLCEVASILPPKGDEHRGANSTKAQVLRSFYLFSMFAETGITSQEALIEHFGNPSVPGLGKRILGLLEPMYEKYFISNEEHELQIPAGANGPALGLH